MIADDEITEGERAALLVASAVHGQQIDHAIDHHLAVQAARRYTTAVLVEAEIVCEEVLVNDRARFVFWMARARQTVDTGTDEAARLADDFRTLAGP